MESYFSWVWNGVIREKSQVYQLFFLVVYLSATKWSMNSIPYFLWYIFENFDLQIFDGHNGISAAIFAKENLLANVLSAIPQGISRDEWLHALPRALVAGFVKTDIEFQQKGIHQTFCFYYYNMSLFSFRLLLFFWALWCNITSGETSGTTVTFVVIDGWTVTVASVGDSRCILDTQGGVVSLLTVDHRLEENEEERARVTASGGEVGRLNVFGGSEV